MKSVLDQIIERNEKNLKELKELKNETLELLNDKDDIILNSTKRRLQDFDEIVSDLEDIQYIEEDGIRRVPTDGDLLEIIKDEWLKAVQDLALLGMDLDE